MERQEILSQNIDWQGLVRHVSRDQVTVELSEGAVAVARLVPIRKPVTMAELDQMLRKLPHLGDDAVLFEKDLKNARSAIQELDDPWES